MSGNGVPPYRIETERLVLRCWDPRDAPLLKDAIDSSLEHLRPWMPWAREEPKPLEATVELLRRFRGVFDLGQDFPYAIFSPDEQEVLGGTGFHTRVGEGAFEIGYWIRAGRAGQGLTTEAVGALTRAAMMLDGIDRLEIHVDPENAASRRIPEKLGYTEEATLRRRLPPLSAGDEPRDEVVYSLLAEEFRASPLAPVPLRAYGAGGERLEA